MRQRMLQSCLTNSSAVTFEMAGLYFDPGGFGTQARAGVAGQRPGKTDGAHRFAFAAAARSGNAGDGQSDLRFAAV